MFKAISLVLFLSVAGCASGQATRLYSPRLWAGSPKDNSIVRSQEKVKISCTDEIFQNYVCLNYDELAHLFEGGVK